jgi:hypothetical protein
LLIPFQAEFIIVVPFPVPPPIREAERLETIIIPVRTQAPIPAKVRKIPMIRFSPCQSSSFRAHLATLCHDWTLNSGKPGQTRRNWRARPVCFALWKAVFDGDILGRPFVFNNIPSLFVEKKQSFFPAALLGIIPGLSGRIRRVSSESLSSARQAPRGAFSLSLGAISVKHLDRATSVRPPVPDMQRILPGSFHQGVHRLYLAYPLGKGESRQNRRRRLLPPPPCALT